MFPEFKAEHKFPQGLLFNKMCFMRTMQICAKNVPVTSRLCVPYMEPGTIYLWPHFYRPKTVYKDSATQLYLPT